MKRKKQRSTKAERDRKRANRIQYQTVHGCRQPFILLGCIFDCKLTMSEDVDRVLAIIRPKVKALLRTRSLLMQYKTHIWGIVEYHYGSICHAAASTICKLDDVQSHFLRGMDMTE